MSPGFRSRYGKILIGCFCIMGGITASFVLKTVHDLLPVPASLNVQNSEIRKPQVTDRHGVPLSVTYLNRWNINPKPLHEFPELVRTAFVESEDRRFYHHGGVDWFARAHALVQNALSMRSVRGASTITEQVVRMLHPRPRTVWSRWLEGIEAMRLETLFSKSEILEFYLNHVPYAYQRRGVPDAALFYFDRDLETLNVRETLALAVLVRAPSHFDLKRSESDSPKSAETVHAERKRSASKAMEKGIARLAGHMRERGLLSEDLYRGAIEGEFELANSGKIIEATHFVQHVFKTVSPEILKASGRLTSTLDGNLQKKVRRILETRLEALKDSGVGNGGVLVCDNASGEVLAWVSGNQAGAESGLWLDAVTVPRQPGSTLKPFLYALAIEMGWTPATIIDDAPLAQPVRSGLHSFHNYSRNFYGPLRLREALGNSLNTPAVRTIEFTGTSRFLDWLHLFGITGLKQSADFYGQGLALGDGEVSLFELVQAYSVLARKGELRPLVVLPEIEGGKPGTASATRDGLTLGIEKRKDALPAPMGRVVSDETSSMIADILSDPQARRLEFGEGHLLRFPVQTAIKTGTSTDHRDCWAVGFTSRYTVGVWMGNFDLRPTNGITGAIGPALVLRSVFAELNRSSEPGPLPVSPGLRVARICAATGLAAGRSCPVINELFRPENVPVKTCTLHSEGQPGETEQYPREVHSDAAVAVAEANQDGDTRFGSEQRRRADSSASGRAINKPSRIDTLRLIQPVPGLEIAFDPRIPPDLQAFAFKLPRHANTSRVEWIVDGAVAGRTRGGKYLWQISRGTHSVKARAWRTGESHPLETQEVSFVVK